MPSKKKPVKKTAKKSAKKNAPKKAVVKKSAKKAVTPKKDEKPKAASKSATKSAVKKATKSKRPQKKEEIVIIEEIIVEQLAGGIALGAKKTLADYILCPSTCTCGGTIANPAAPMTEIGCADTKSCNNGGCNCILFSCDSALVTAKKDTPSDWKREAGPGKYAVTDSDRTYQCYCVM